MDESTEVRQEGVTDQPISRRRFLKIALLGVAGTATAVGVLTPIIAYLWPPKQATAAGGGPTAVAPAEDLPVGKGAVYSVNNKPVLVIHTSDGYHAVSAVCTHLGCILFWAEDRGVIACPCHAGFFNTNGAVISGPPPAPLAVYRVQVEGGQIYVEGGQG